MSTFKLESLIKKNTRAMYFTILRLVLEKVTIDPVNYIFKLKLLKINMS